MDVTVAIPCYNGAQYVEGAIEAILHQTHPVHELLVIDDGSADGSNKVISHYPVRLIQHGQNLGLAAARNTAVSEATGDVIIFVDVDAYADADLVSTLLGGYDRPEVGGVGGQGIEANIRSLADRWRRAHASQSHGQRPRDVQFLYGLCMSFRLEALREVGGFNPALRTNAEDLDIGLRLSAAGYRLRYLPDAEVYHQRTDDIESLKRTMTAWCTAAYRVKCLNRHQPWRVVAGTLRRVVADPICDLVVRRDASLAHLSWQIGWSKLRALRRTMVELDTRGKLCT